MSVALLSALDELTPRALGELAGEPEVAFGDVQEALLSADRCPATCGPCSRGTEFCDATGRTLS
ncbi:hypothetical protein [Catenuloplanes indicus]|uniref:Uncharacterized protein n=1 Tax=Catenuloplanes indicus TaxID=137267 RepID=A0AAE3VTZ5_9ACTN|nr:hypothetical protein [Catenuloplanes indicus]MDQ0364183.1 hypothetical protein [Catenuloplanes indicus]